MSIHYRTINVRLNFRMRTKFLSPTIIFVQFCWVSSYIFLPKKNYLDFFVVGFKFQIHHHFWPTLFCPIKVHVIPKLQTNQYLKQKQKVTVYLKQLTLMRFGLFLESSVCQKLLYSLKMRFNNKGLVESEFRL